MCLLCYSEADWLLELCRYPNRKHAICVSCWQIFLDQLNISVEKLDVNRKMRPASMLYIHLKNHEMYYVLNWPLQQLCRLRYFKDTKDTLFKPWRIWCLGAVIYGVPNPLNGPFPSLDGPHPRLIVMGDHTVRYLRKSWEHGTYSRTIFFHGFLPW